LYWPTHSFCKARGCRKRCSTKGVSIPI